MTSADSNVPSVQRDTHTHTRAHAGAPTAIIWGLGLQQSSDNALFAFSTNPDKLREVRAVVLQHQVLSIR